ncbi:MAG: excinuclease ABC subunit UvrC [Methylohalobius sp.]|nr:excinuclease ABC subunit UvrC [Methylohalobius sp.]
MDNSAFDLEDFLKTLTSLPGVYKMLDAEGKPLYIGKAGNLKQRITSYFRGQPDPKRRALLAKLKRIEVTVTRTEGEALLLESQWVKRYQPRYNVCLKDDKSYPYIYISTAHPFPRVGFHRGAKTQPGRYFGPYPSAGAVRQTLKLLKKLFLVRQCEDSYYNHRSRPCLEYQIKRCRAPCVGYVDQVEYRQDVEDTIAFLEGKGYKLVDALVQRMESAAERLQFEQAARYRDQIASLRAILEDAGLGAERGDLDAIAVAMSERQVCVHVAWFRGGRYLGDKAHYPMCPVGSTPAQILAAFLSQYYLDKPIPGEILLSHSPEDLALLTETLSSHAGRKVRLITRPRGQRQKWLELARANAKAALDQRVSQLQGLTSRWVALRELLGLDSPVQRLECFDISHIRGEQTVASCVVFSQEGAIKSAYRKFNIQGVVPGDDYAALAQAVRRRFSGQDQELPDLLLIDGGKGQVQAVQAVLTELGLSQIPVVGIAKGERRRSGEEKLYLSWRDAWLELRDHPGLLLICQVRDEAHRFAITGHRQRRARARQSILESIVGLGPRRRERLLKQFGGLRAIKKASVEALSSVEGISPKLAQRIYETLHT